MKQEHSLDDDVKISSPQKGSTVGTSSGPTSTVAEDILINNDLGVTNVDDANMNHRFNLRDRKRICYNKKYGGFVLYNQEQDNADMEREDGNPDDNLDVEGDIEPK